MGWDDNGLPDRAPGPALLRRALRPLACATTPPSSPPRSRDAAGGGVAAQLHRAVHPAGGRGREGLRAPVADARAVGRLDQTYATIDDRARRASQRGFLRLLAAGPRLPAEAPTQWDVDFQTAVSQAEMEEQERPGAYHRRRASHRADDATARSRSRRPAPSCWPPAWRSWPIPTTRRYRRCSAPTVRTPLFGVRVPVLAHALADPEKGSGIAMICTFGDTTDVTGGASWPCPTRTIVGRNGRLRARGVGPPGGIATTPPRPPPPTASSPGKNVHQARTRIVELLAAVGGARGRAPPDRPPGQVLRAGRPSARDRVQPAVVRAHAAPAATAARAGPRAGAGTRRTCAHRYESWVEGLNGDWNISRQRFFGVPFPVWYPVGDDGERRPRPPVLRRRGRLPVDPSSDVPDGYAEDQRGRPAGSSATPTSWTRGPRRRSRRRSPARWERRPRPVRPGLPHGPAPPGPRDHPHLAVLHRRAQPSWSTVALPWTRRRPLGLGARPRPQEDVEVARATSSPRCPCSRRTAPTPCATGRPAAGRAPTRPWTKAR